MPDARCQPNTQTRSCRLQAQHARNQRRDPESAPTTVELETRLITSVNLVKITRLRVVWNPEFSCALAVEIFSAAPQQAAASSKQRQATDHCTGHPSTVKLPRHGFSTTHLQDPSSEGLLKRICKHDRTPDLFSSLVHPLRGSCCRLLLPQHHQVCWPSSWLTGWRCISPGPRPWRHWAEPPHDISCPQHSQTWRESEPRRVSWYASQQ